MKQIYRGWLGVGFGLATVSVHPAWAAAATKNQVTITKSDGRVDAWSVRAGDWTSAQTNQVLLANDQVRTGERSGATLRLLDASDHRMDEFSHLRVLPLPGDESRFSFFLEKGKSYFFHRGGPANFPFQTKFVAGVVRGTEFHLAVEDNGRTVVTLFDGEVGLTNQFGGLLLASGEQAVVDPNQSPVKTPVIDAISIIQWCLYYPGVLDVDELGLDAGSLAALQDSVVAYRAGDLRQALAAYPAGRQPGSGAERIYLGALLLSVGRVDQAEPLFDPNLGAVPGAAVESAALGRIARALREVVATVKQHPAESPLAFESANSSATEWLAESYRHQARAELPEALQAARSAVARSPRFGFAWVRVAELEFSFGRTRAAITALDQGVKLSPSNAQAAVVRGFLHAAQSRISDAMSEFNRALALDSRLGNAWLGRGLCRIRHGDVAGGREDLQQAALMEPQRALFRSYLGKAWQELHQSALAEHELHLAEERDPRDPTSSLYRALLLQQNNRVNEAVAELEHSQELNDNRRVYRSQFLLDQDRAVRGANLANIYRDAGLTDWSVREASRAVDADYGNGAAHQFLADSYFALRDPRQVNLRYETPALAEHLLANLLSPVGATTLSPLVSQQEYSRLFDRRRFGVSSDTTYLSRGAWTEAGAVYGFAGRTAFALDAFYHSDPGERRNQDFEERTFDFRLKYQVSDRDEFYFEATHSVRDAGDVRAAYSEDSILTQYRTEDRIDPTVVAGWHRAWTPGSHTLLLAGWLHADYRVNDPIEEVGVILWQTNSAQQLVSLLPIGMSQSYRGRLGIWTTEGQHIWQRERHTTLAGALFQSGEFETVNRNDTPQSDLFDTFFQELPVRQEERTGFERHKVYGYHHWQAFEKLRLSAGLAYDWLRYPANHRSAPVSGEQSKQSRWLPKAGLVWTPEAHTTFRGGVAWALAGTSFDQSFQLEPTQIAGFNQSFRSLIPEAVAGANAGARFRVAGLSLERRWAARTYAVTGWERRDSVMNRRVGVFGISDSDTFDKADALQPVQHVGYTENTLLVTLLRLLSDEWAIGGGYRLGAVDYEERFGRVEADPTVDIASGRRALLHRVDGRVLFNHPSGLFGEAQAIWSRQDNGRDDAALSHDSFWQFNVFSGWRWWRRQAELTVGILNLTDADYRLNPLSGGAEPPRGRTFLARLRVTF